MADVPQPPPVSMAQDIPDWSGLQHDLLVLIARRFNLIEDYLTFGTVCKSWHSAATKNNFNSDLPRLPWLMLAEDENNSSSSCRQFFSVMNGMILNKTIPGAKGKRCMESMGWLITVGKDDGEISLLHPFSGFTIELPHQNTTQHYEFHQTPDPWTFFQKGVLSASPSHTSDYVLMIIEGDIGFLSFCRPGDLWWTRLWWERASHSPHCDVVYFNDKFYAVDFMGRVVVCDVAGPEPTRSHIVAQVPLGPGFVGDRLYILESLGSLFVLVRDGVGARAVKDDSERIPLTLLPDEDEDVEATYGTTNIQVFQVDLAAGKMTQTRELGDRAFFIGHSGSISVQASQFPGIKPNHIYFTDDHWESYLSYVEGGGLDMGVFNLADGSIHLHYKGGVSLSRISPPTWVTPTMC